MLAMPSYKDSIHLSYQNALLAGKSHTIHDLEEEEDCFVALQTSSAHRFLPGAAGRRNRTRFIEPFACDDFQMYEYKVRQCMRSRSHDWTNCPFTHPGEKARRRDPQKIHYSGSPCPDFRKGCCRRGDACEYAHGVFECWLHPARYRTQVCKDGKGCTRRVCFFAHSTEQLRHVAEPVEESRKESVSMVDSYVHEVDSHTHDLGSPLHRILLEDSFKGRVSMADSDECELGLPSQTDLSEDCLTAVVLSSNSPCGADSTVDFSSQHVYSNVSSISEMLSTLTLSSQNVLSSPVEAMGLSSNNPMGVTSLPSPNFLSKAPGPSNKSSEMGATSQDDSFTFEWSSPPAVFSPASNLQLYTPFMGGLSSSKCHTANEHLSYVCGSPSQQAAAWQTFPMREGYSGGGESTFSASADELSDMVYYGRYGDGAMQQGYFKLANESNYGADELSDVVYYRGYGDAVMQQGYFEIANESNEASKSTHQLAPLRKELYEFSSYNANVSYGVPSPTSTLAGPLCSPPFSSPPLSPLSTPSSGVTNVFSSRGHGNVHVEDTHTFTDPQSLHLNHHSRLLGHGKGNTTLLPRVESPSFSRCTGDSCTSGLNKWSPCNRWNSEDTYNCDVLQLKLDMQHKICGRFGGESSPEYAMPDLGWVHELVM